MTSDGTSVAELAAQMLVPGFMLLLGLGLITRRHWQQEHGRRVLILVLVVVIASPLFTGALHLFASEAMSLLVPGEDGDGSLFYSWRIIAIAASVWLLPFLLLLAAIAVALVRWASEGHWLRWSLPCLIVILGLWLTPTVVLGINDRYGYGIAHRLHFCGPIGGARALHQDLQQERDLSLDGISGIHGIPALSPGRCHSLQQPAQPTPAAESLGTPYRPPRSPSD